MQEEVRDAWEKTEKELGFNPIFDETGKIKSSELFGVLFLMQHKHLQKGDNNQAAKDLFSPFSDKKSAITAMRGALNKANDPLVPRSNNDPVRLEKERQFYEVFLSYLS